jgi:hypothetical protein
VPRTFLSELVATRDTYRREQVRPVRVVEYGIDDDGRPGARNTTYRLLTTILDSTQAPADELAAHYGQRAQIESNLDELGPASAAAGSSCAHEPLRASTRKPGATCACTTHDARSSAPLPTTATWTPTGSASPRPCTPPGDTSDVMEPHRPAGNALRRGRCQLLLRLVVEFDVGNGQVLLQVLLG